jgi:hypothetical protein
MMRDPQTLPFRAPLIVTHQAVTEAYVPAAGTYQIKVEWGENGEVAITLTPAVSCFSGPDCGRAPGSFRA